MAENQYIYAVARIRCREQRLLNASFLEQLVTAPDAEAYMRLLGEKGWDGGGPEDSDGMLAQEQKRTWDLMRELVQDMSVFDVFLYENDYHNLKAAIKECKSPNAFSNIYLSQGTVPVERIRQAVQENRLEDLPERMREPAREARQALLHTGDGQLCDMILDRAALEAVRQAGEASGNEFLKLYGELTVAAADIKMAVRASRTGKNRAFLDTALVECRTLNRDSLARAALDSEEAVAAYLEKTDYQDGAQELRESPSAFERWCDNLLIRRIRPQLRNPFGIGPLAAYILARDNEIKSVRIILAGKRNRLPEEAIRERVRETYV